MEVQTYERMATLEAKLSTIESLLTKLDDKFDSLNNAYVPRAEIDVLFRQRDDQIAVLKLEIINIRQDKHNNRALLPAWVATVIALIALVAPYIKH